MRSIILAAAAALLLTPGLARAEKPPELTSLPEAARKVGETEFRVLFWRVFDAELWSGDGAFAWSAPFALTLTYARDFTSAQLTERTLEEMARISGAPEASFKQFGRDFAACIDDVQSGDRITAVSVAEDKARMFQNGAERCTLQRSNLRQTFFGIWLSDTSSFPEASQRLRGGKPS